MSQVKDAFERLFTVARIIDGDTIVAADVDLGYHIHVHGIEFRILHVNSPERHGDTKPAGDIAKEFTTAWLALHGGHSGLFATTVKTDSFGRYLAVIRCGLGHDLADALLGSGNALPYK